MSTLETEAAETAPAYAAPESRSKAPVLRRRKSPLGKVVLVLLLGATVAGAIYAKMTGRMPPEVDRVVTYVQKYLPSGSPPAAQAETPAVKVRPPWDGYVDIQADQARSIGLEVATVKPQVEPIRLELNGRTDYDPYSLNKVRPRFDTLVETVRAELGQMVKKGDPLVDLFSTELAAAKNDFQTAFVQWQHDLRLLELRQKLKEQNAISEQALVDTQNDENKSRLAYLTSREKLSVLGVPEEDIDPLIKNLGDLPNRAPLRNVVDKAKMTRLSPVDGIIIQREVVPGNLYDTNDVLMVIAPLDHLFVWASVYEKDQAKVAIGQRIDIDFPFLNRTIRGTVEYVSSEVSKETRAVKIRASIPNVDAKLKADMLVRAFLEIPPVPGQTVIPRLAMVVMGGEEYAFVRKPGTLSDMIQQFERRKLVIAQERSDQVVVAEGLRVGDEVASNGSLILSQLYEDQQMVETGLPVK
jgi:cobalt-zinc-cadmium efflux system membrane fusion protein